MAFPNSPTYSDQSNHKMKWMVWGIVEKNPIGLFMQIKCFFFTLTYGMCTSYPMPILVHSFFAYFLGIEVAL